MCWLGMPVNRLAALCWVSSAKIHLIDNEMRFEIGGLLGLFHRHQQTSTDLFGVLEDFIGGAKVRHSSRPKNVPPDPVASTRWS